MNEIISMSWIKLVDLYWVKSYIDEEDLQKQIYAIVEWRQNVVINRHKSLCGLI